MLLLFLLLATMRLIVTTTATRLTTIPSTDACALALQISMECGEGTIVTFHQLAALNIIAMVVLHW